MGRSTLDDSRKILYVEAQDARSLAKRVARRSEGITRSNRASSPLQMGTLA